MSLFQNYNNNRNVCLKNLLGVLSGKKITVPTYVITAISFFPPPLKYFIQHTFLHLFSYVSLIVKSSFFKQYIGCRLSFTIPNLLRPKGRIEPVKYHRLLQPYVSNKKYPIVWLLCFFRCFLQIHVLPLYTIQVRICVNDPLHVLLPEKHLYPAKLLYSQQQCNFFIGPLSTSFGLIFT